MYLIAPDIAAACVDVKVEGPANTEKTREIAQRMSHLIAREKEGENVKKEIDDLLKESQEVEGFSNIETELAILPLTQEAAEDLTKIYKKAYPNELNLHGTLRHREDVIITRPALITLKGETTEILRKKEEQLYREVTTFLGNDPIELLKEALESRQNPTTIDWQETQNGVCVVVPRSPGITLN